MTTAHRPQIVAARGGEEQGGNRFFVPSLMRSSKDATAHTKLKQRHDLEGATGAEMKEELLREERRAAAKKQGIEFEEERQRDLELLNSGRSTGLAGRKRPAASAALEEGPSADAAAAGIASGAGPPGAAAARRLVPNPEDADDVGDDDDEDDEQSSGSSSDDDDDSDDSDSESDDEEEELRRELERIRRERAEEAERRAQEAAEREQAEKIEEVRGGNPLLDLEGGAGGGGAGGGASSSGAGAGLRRRWDEDVVFKNQARGEPKAQRRFINDTVRSDFHRRFMNRYIK